MIKTDSIEKVLSYSKYSRPDCSFLSASEIAGSSDYQLWLAGQKTPKTYVTDLETNVNSMIGSGLHLYCEQAMKGEPNVSTEVELLGQVDGEWISGTTDLMRVTEAHGIIFEDWKTKGTYQAKKALQGDNEDVVIQLSIYRYLDWLENPESKYCDYGLINLFVTGDAGYFNKADGGGKIPKYKQIPVKLMSFERTEALIKHKIAVAKQTEQFKDCESWRCDYCNYECSQRSYGE